jgi:uncharacterized SAM-binding protein YcdF (DUF218 family)
MFGPGSTRLNWLSDASGRTEALRWRARSWRRSMMLAVLAALIVCIWLGREPLLRGTASLWIVSDPLTRADAIVVLGGDSQERPLRAAELYRRGLADKVLLSQTAEVEQVAVGAAPSDAELNRTALLKLGVPPGAIENFGTANTNTMEEAVAVKEWAKRNAASVFLVPAEIFSARRVRWTFDRVLSGSAVTIVPSFEPPGYTRSEWWKKEEGVIAFQNELLKYLYYRLRY